MSDREGTKTGVSGKVVSGQGFPQLSTELSTQDGAVLEVIRDGLELFPNTPLSLAELVRGAEFAVHGRAVS
ncbi:MAG: hypothetical protein KAJ18_12340 [Candidatus Omnitrophica bacterium]|nr:hypothetical protein [Candidatus Omnitrophota bacterium]